MIHFAQTASLMISLLFICFTCNSLTDCTPWYFKRSSAMVSGLFASGYQVLRCKPNSPERSGPLIRAGGSVFRGGLKITRPKCIHLFSGGGPGVSRCILRVPGVSRGMTGVSRCIFFFQRTKKSQVYLLGVARCISRFSGGGWLPLDVLGGGWLPLDVSRRILA